MKVVPCTMGARAPTNETLTSLTWRSPARPDACSALSIWCEPEVRALRDSGRERADGAPACAAILMLRQPGAFTFRRAGTHYHRPPGRSCRVAGEHGGASVESAYRERAQRARAVSLHEPLDLPPHRR